MMASNNDWLGPKTAQFKSSLLIVSIVAAITVTITEVNSRGGLGFRLPSLIHSMILWLAGLSSSLLLAGLAIRLCIWIRDRTDNPRNGTGE